MRLSLVVVLIICLFLFSCKKIESEVIYLQKKEVQLVQPRIIASNTVIDSFVTVKAYKNIEGTELYYSDDGSDPTKSSTQFTGEIVVKEAKELKFKAFHKDFKASKAGSVKLFKKGHSVASIEWFTNTNNKYKGSGVSTVINDKKGSLEFNSPQWMGFDTIAKAIVKFHKNTTIKSIDIGYLNDPASWIFPPSEIEVIVNENIKDKLTFRLEPLTALTNRAAMNFIIPINQEVNTLGIMVKNVQQIPDWHDGKGKKAWLFMDEWIFN